LWSLAIGTDVRRCVGELSKLYDRALRSHARSIAIATPGQEASLFVACDRAILLTNKIVDEPDDSIAQDAAHANRVIELPLRAADTWEQVLASLASRR
jgi:hypothetical protein